MTIEPRHPLSPKGEFVISYEFFPAEDSRRWRRSSGRA